MAGSQGSAVDGPTSHSLLEEKPASGGKGGALQAGVERTRAPPPSLLVTSTGTSLLTNLLAALDNAWQLWTTPDPFRRAFPLSSCVCSHFEVLIKSAR